MRRAAGLAALIAVCVGGVAVAASPDGVRESWSAIRRLLEPGWTSARCLGGFGGEVERFEADGLRLAARLLPPSDAGEEAGGGGPAPTLLLIHGSYPEGKDAPLPRVLASAFSSRGYRVIALDLRGFGASEGPSPPYGADAFDFGADVVAALDHLAAADALDASRLAVLGHSLGAGAAVAARRRDARLRALVLFGPPRRLRERVLAPGAPDRGYFLHRLAADMRLPRAPDDSEMRESYRRMDLAYRPDELFSAGPVDLFLVDAGRESAADRAFLRTIADSLGPRADYWTVPGTGHYLGVAGPGTLACYNRRVVDRFVDRVDAWLRERGA